MALPLKILAIEEDEVDRRILAKFFAGFEGKAVITELNRSALSCLRQEGPFAVILLSFSRSPDLALRLLKVLQRDFKEVPVIVIGNFLCGNRAAEFKALGARMIIHKPFLADCIFEAIQQCGQATLPEPAKNDGSWAQVLGHHD